MLLGVHLDGKHQELAGRKGRHERRQAGGQAEAEQDEHAPVRRERQSDQLLLLGSYPPLFILP